MPRWPLGACLACWMGTPEGGDRSFRILALPLEANTESVWTAGGLGLPGAPAPHRLTCLGEPRGPRRSGGCLGARRAPRSHPRTAAVPGPVALGASDGGPQLGIGAPQHVLLAGLVVQRPAGLQGLPVQPRPALLAALQAPLQHGQRVLRLVQLCPQPLSLRRGVQLGATAGRLGSGAGAGRAGAAAPRTATGSVSPRALVGQCCCPPAPAPRGPTAWLCRPVVSSLLPPRGRASPRAQAGGAPTSPGPGPALRSLLGPQGGWRGLHGTRLCPHISNVPTQG